MNDDFLTQFRKPPREKFAAELYQRISQPMHTPFKVPTLRFAALALATLAIIVTAFFVLPPARAYAQEILYRIGGYIFVQGTPQPDPLKKDLSGKTALSPEQQATQQAEKQQLNVQAKKQAQAKKDVTASFARDAAAASQMAGFSVLAPAYIPAGYTPGDVKNVSGGWAVFQEDKNRVAYITYQNQDGKSFLGIEQLKYQQDHPKTVERPQIVDVTVRGQEGVWMPDQGGKNALVWEENGITFTVVSNTLPLEELLKVAESLGK